MIEARIFERPDKCYAKSIYLFDGRLVYNFKKDEWIEQERNIAVITDDPTLTISHEAYCAIAKAIEQDKSLPKTQLSFVEGKLEATEYHLKDMRSLVLQKERK